MSDWPYPTKKSLYRENANTRHRPRRSPGQGRKNFSKKASETGPPRRGSDPARRWLMCENRVFGKYIPRDREKNFDAFPRNWWASSKSGIFFVATGGGRDLGRDAGDEGRATPKKFFASFRRAATRMVAGPFFSRDRETNHCPTGPPLTGGVAAQGQGARRCLAQTTEGPHFSCASPPVATTRGGVFG